MDSIHIAKQRREQEDLQHIQPMKAVDSIAVTKARREQDRDGQRCHGILGKQLYTYIVYIHNITCDNIIIYNLI